MSSAGDVTTTPPDGGTAWAERLADRSPSVQRSRDRSVKQARVIVDAARRLVADEGDNLTINELVKEAGVALQTFYRYFSGKDELLLAVLENLILEACEGFELRAAHLADPVDRLHSHVTSVFALLDETGGRRFDGRFVASEHWRLSQSFPAEVAVATKPYADLLHTEITAGVEAGTLRGANPERDAWMIGQLVLSVFHQRSFLGTDDPDLGVDVWRFCFAALGGRAG